MIDDDRVVYYDINDFAYDMIIEKMIIKLNDFDKNYKHIDIVGYLELQHILKYLKEKDDNIQKHLKDKGIDVKEYIGKINRTINTFKYVYSFEAFQIWNQKHSFVQYGQEYVGFLFDKKIINPDIVADMFKVDRGLYHFVLEKLMEIENQKKLKNEVKDLKILDILLSDIQYSLVLINFINNKKLNSKSKIFDGYESKVLEYITEFLNKISVDNVPFNWDMIYNSKNKIYTDEIKYFAEQKEREYWDNHFKNGGGFQHGAIRFSTTTKIKDIKEDYVNGEYHYQYNPNLALGITNAFDNPLSIFNFFKFINSITGNFSDIKKNLFFPSLTELFSSGKNNYTKGDSIFNIFYTQRIFQLDTYIKTLEQNNISFEKKLAYYIEVYLLDRYNFEFNVRSDLENLVKTDSYNYKCRIMCTMIESICNQYKEIVDKGSFDLEFLIKYGIFNLEDMKAKSLKRAVLKNKDSVYNLFFHDQNSLYQWKDKCDFYTYIVNNSIKYSEFIEKMRGIKEKLQLLIDKNLVKIKNDIITIVNKEKIAMMKVLLEEESIILMPQIVKRNQSNLDELIKEEEIEIDIETNLFSQKELDYLSYHLNNKKFDDSLALRNKYQHNGHTGNVEKDYPNYLTLLKILILILLRIDQDQELATIEGEM